MTLVLLFLAVSASAWFGLAAVTRPAAQIERVRAWGAPAGGRRRARLSRAWLHGAVLAAAGAAIAAAAGTGPARGALLAAALGAAGVLGPRALARGRVERRAERIRGDLPDALDLLGIGITAGLSLDAALARLVETGDGPLVDELARVLAEVRVGEARDRALARLAERVPAVEVATLVRALVQAEHLGVPLAETLRAQAEDVRRRRAADAEERAGKAPVKMLLPTAVFIFPALFVVVLAPAILQLTRQL